MPILFIGVAIFAIFFDLAHVACFAIVAALFLSEDSVSITEIESKENSKSKPNIDP